MISIPEFFRKLNRKIRLRLSNRIEIRKLEEVDIIPTLKCNLNCVMCHQAEIKCKQNMTFEEFKKIVISLKSQGVTKVSLVGGEIYVLKEINQFIDFLENVGLRYDIATNAIALTDEDISKFKRLKGLEKVSTSIDGDEKIHNKIRRNPIAYQRTSENIIKLLKNKINLNVGIVLQKANFNKIEEIFENICKMGVKDISFLYEIRVNENEKRATQDIIKKITGKESEIFISSKENPFGDLNEEEIKEIKLKLDNILKIAEKYNAKVNFPLQIEDTKVLNKNYPLTNNTCSIFTGYNFSVYNDLSIPFCPFIQLKGDYNIVKNNPLNVVNSKEYVLLRKFFKKYGAFPVCRRCCALTHK